MQRRTRFWVIAGLLFVVLAACVWRFGLDHARTNSSSFETAAIAEPRHEPVPELGPLNYRQATPVITTNVVAASDTNVSHNAPLLAYRVTNTRKTIGELVYCDSCILLRNALFDAAEPAPLEIHPHLKAQGVRGSYAVQVQGAIDGAFLSRLNASGAQIIS